MIVRIGRALKGALVRLTGWMLVLAGSPALAAPTVVSIDSCADQYVLALAEDAQILALSPDAWLPSTYYLQRAKTFPRHRGTLEELMLLDPDVVLSTGAGGFGLAAALDRFGVRVVRLGLADDFNGALQSLEAAGKALETEERAGDLAADFRRRRHALAIQAAAERPAALYLSPSGITTGEGTFLDEVLRLAGLDNFASQKGINGWGSVGLEDLAADPPQMIIASFFDSRVGAAESWRLTSHPAARTLLDRTSTIEVPARLLSCPAWYAIEAVELIRAEAKP